MKDRDKTKQSVLSLGLNGKLFTLEDVISIPGVADDSPREDASILKKGRARSYLRYVYSSEGLKLRSVGKNTYKVVDENDPAERVAEDKRNEKRLQKSWHQYKQYREFRIGKGDPIQTEMYEADMMILLEGGEMNVPSAKPNQVVPVTSASSKSKKASGQ